MTDDVVTDDIDPIEEDEPELPDNGSVPPSDPDPQEEQS
jgi:hypothetical protein